MRPTFEGQRFSIDIQAPPINVTSEHPTPNEKWRETDSNGHQHYYDHGYPTLDLVIDAEHWCMGNEGLYAHDPHMAVDESHYECRICREVVEPEMDPGGTPKYISGMVSGTLTGDLGPNERGTIDLLPDELAALRAPGANLEGIALRLLRDAPDERIRSREWSSSPR